LFKNGTFINQRFRPKVNIFHD